MTVQLDVAKEKRARPEATQRNDMATPPSSAQCPGRLGTPGPCLSDGVPVVFRHLTRLALWPAHCLARIVALWMVVDHGSFTSVRQLGVAKTNAAPDQKSARWLDLVDLASLAGTCRWRLKSCQSLVPPGRSAAQKSQSVPVTKLPPPPFSPSRFPLHRPFPRPPSHHRRPKNPRRRRRR
ncbi:hypothetical protein B0T09DRAFT_5789 [Sordaria sp. MPI-SDFR-AT-0083]|nr:hypothetical protein B0T09DRAFT_5789 [Sordaria sp. MPI-SDFR-AT-0083]